jgi:alpha-L-fucosidase 2
MEYKLLCRIHVALVLLLLLASPAFGQAPANSHPLRIGADQSGENRFRGGIAAVRLYDRALSAEDVAALAAAKPDASASARKPLREWLLGTLADQRVVDSMQQSIATVTGAVKLDSSGGVACGRFGGGYLEAKDDGALKFDRDFAVEAWVRPAGGATCRIVDKITPGGSNGFLLDFLDGDLRFIRGGQTAIRAWESPTATWTHVCATCAGGTINLYINGKTAGKAVSAKPAITFEGAAAPPQSPLTLWWKAPGKAWTEAMILGNGRLGAMVAGGVQQENVWINDDTLWSGENVTSHSKTALAAFPKIKQLLLDRNEPAANSMYSQMFGPYNEVYMPLGNLNILFPITGKIQDYQRTLDLPTGTARVKYTQEGITYTREAFVSFPDQAVIMRLTADKPEKISFSANLSSRLRNESTTNGGVLRMTGRCPSHANPDYAGGALTYDEGTNPKGMRFATEVRAISDGGKVSAEDGQIVAEHCNAVTLVLVAATSYNGFDKSPSREGKDPVALCEKQLAAAQAVPYVELQSRHVADFRALMDRVSLTAPQTEAAKRPINERVGGGFQQEDLPALTALYYQFGRYLLVSSSRPGSQPANLQGIWNDTTKPGWSSNWTMNCNANFNYLGVEAANLPELHEPFIRMIQEWSVDGARVAKNWYGCRGWVGHHNIDLWRAACPVSGDPCWAAFVCGGAWGCQDLWEHYAFTQDREYLRQVWPTLRGAAEFFLDLLVKDPKTGYLVTVADTNFENAYRRPDGSATSLCIAPTPSNMMVRQLFLNCIAATKVLNCDADMRAQMEKAVLQLPPTLVSPQDGEIQEYLDPGYKIAYRQVCELLSTWGLIWSDQVTLRKTPDLAAAIRKAYEAPDRRPWVTGEVASWQGAFPANTFARLDDGARVAEILTTHFRRVPNPNLSANFRGFWEIDGNLGNMAAIGETLLQSQAGEIELLPALLPSWRTGSVKGLRSRGGFEVDLAWKEGQLVEATVHSNMGGSCKVRYGDHLIDLPTQPGHAYRLDDQLHAIQPGA